MTFKVLSDGEHPAAVAWGALQPADGTPPSLEQPSLTEDVDTNLYRLMFPNGLPVIAKRCDQVTGLVERAAYGCVLAKLPITGPHFYGSVRDEDRIWLFLEDVTGESYEPKLADHRSAAARWLAELHIGVQDTAAKSLFPDRGSNHYLLLLESALATIRREASSRALPAIDLRVLAATDEHCVRLVADWQEVEEACADLPYTIVHGDFIPKNVFVRRSGSSIEILPIDWEKAGWGILAEDLSTVDLDEYLASTRGSFPDLTIELLSRAAAVGKIFRSIVFVNWAANGLSATASDATAQLALANGWLEVLLPRLLPNTRM